jgi:hypothetical protein
LFREKRDEGDAEKATEVGQTSKKCWGEREAGRSMAKGLFKQGSKVVCRDLSQDCFYPVPPPILLQKIRCSSFEKTISPEKRLRKTEFR